MESWGWPDFELAQLSSDIQAAGFEACDFNSSEPAFLIYKIRKIIPSVQHCWEVEIQTSKMVTRLRGGHCDLLTFFFFLIIWSLGSERARLPCSAARRCVCGHSALIKLLQLSLGWLLPSAAAFNFFAQGSVWNCDLPKMPPQAAALLCGKP